MVVFGTQRRDAVLLPVKANGGHEVGKVFGVAYETDGEVDYTLQADLLFGKGEEEASGIGAFPC